MAGNEGAPAAGGEGGAVPAQGGLDDFDALVGASDPFAQDGQGDASDAVAGDSGGDSPGGGDVLDDAMGAAEADANADPDAELDAAADDAEPFDDEPDAEQEPEVEPIHGLKPDDILNAIKDGKIPDELMDKLTITQTIDGEDVPVTLAEARKNGMRLSDYSRKNNELQVERRQFETARDDLVTMVQSWKDPTPEGRRRTRQMLEDYAGPDVLLEIARDMADEHMYIQSLSPEGRAEHTARRKAEREAREARLRAERLERQMQERQQRQGTEGLAAKVNAMRDTAFKKMNIHLNAHTDGIFRAHLRGLYQGGEVTPALAEEAAQATMEDLARIREGLQTAEQSKAKAEAGATRAKLPPKAAPRGGGKPGNRARPKRAGVADFDKLLGLS